MKFQWFKCKTLLSLAFLAFSLNALAQDAALVLQARLKQLQHFHADYEQTLRSPKGDILQRGTGELFLKRPAQFRIQSLTPQESELISDGKTLWFYDPFVEQATARPLRVTLQNTPFVLITGANNQRAWQQYNVVQKGNQFTLTPKTPQNHIARFSLAITAKGELLGFSTTEKSGQQNNYVLTKASYAALPDSTFRFTPPEGTEIDDQR